MSGSGDEYRAGVPVTADEARNALDSTHCRWCGCVLTVAGALYCSREHKAEVRRQRLEAVRRCPHPEKRVIAHRGTALLWALRAGAEPYLCCCGLYHLTSPRQR